MGSLTGQISWKGNIRELDGLRGIAIFLVLLHHFWPKSGGGPLADWEKLAHLGWIGVDLFFVISGFLIAGILLDTRGEPNYYLNFYARRSLRIFPLYYLFLAVVFTAVPLMQQGSYWNTEFIRESGSPLWYVFYSGNIREAIWGQEPAYFLAPLWSLSIEEQFYITFPFVVAALGPLRLGKLLWALIVIAPVFRTVMLFLVPGNERIQYLATFSRMDVISMGCLLALSLRQGRVRISPGQNSALLVVLLAAMGVAFSIGGLNRMLPFCRTLGYSLVAITFACVVLWTVQHRGSPATSFLRFRPLTYLGKICYGVYLLQRPSEVLLLRVLGRAGIELPEGSAILLVLKVLTAIAVASISWALFESKMLRLKDKFVSRNHPSDPEVIGKPLAPSEALPQA